MPNTAPFTPTLGKAKTISATSTSSSVTLDAVDVSSTPTPANAGPSGGHSVIRVVNAGPNAVRIRWGVGAQTAIATDMLVLAGNTEVFSKAGDVDTVAAICAATQTASVDITCGEGM